jgi:hypothetical protein
MEPFYLTLTLFGVGLVLVVLGALILPRHKALGAVIIPLGILAIWAGIKQEEKYRPEGFAAWFLNRDEERALIREQIKLADEIKPHERLYLCPDFAVSEVKNAGLLQKWHKLQRSRHPPTPNVEQTGCYFYN